MEVLRPVGGIEHAAISEEVFREKISLSRQPNLDPVKRAINLGSLEAEATVPLYSHIIDIYRASEKVAHPSYINNKEFSALQAVLIDEDYRSDYGYPRKFAENPDEVVDFIAENFQDTRQPAYMKFVRYLMAYPLQTNRLERAVVPAFLAGIRSWDQHLQGLPTVHEWGAAARAVIHNYAMGQMLKLPDSQVEIVDDTETPDATQSALFNTFIGAAGFGKGIAIEAKPPKTPEEIDFVKACTFDPMQLDREARGSGYEDRFDLLVETNAVTLIEANFLRFNRAHEALLDDNKADIIFIPHSLSQNMKRVTKVIQTASRFLKAKGIIAINEYAEPDPANPQRLNFPERWYSEPWLCKTIIFDPSNSEQGFYTVLEWDTARCRRAKIVGEGISRLMSSYFNPFE